MLAPANSVMTEGTMLNLMDDPPRWGRTLRTYLILIGCATNRQTITYGTLGDRTNEIARNLRRHLDPIYRYCEANGLPRLTVLAVRQGTEVPGDGYPGPRDTIDADREAVFQYDWFNIAPPTIVELQHFGN